MIKLIKILILTLTISSCSIINMMRDDENQDDITNNRRHVYMKNYGNLETAKEKVAVKFYDEDWGYDEERY
ncbi:MAG TPA: hypothetical protein VI861_03170 [Rickettsiales bacterium]|nr:hypothetical protein [Rickettsiales bacterium]